MLTSLVMTCIKTLTEPNNNCPIFPSKLLIVAFKTVYNILLILLVTKRKDYKIYKAAIA